MRILGLLLVTIINAGCVASYHVSSLSGAHNNLTLDKNIAVYVNVPQDGAYESKIYYGSGQIVAQAVAAAFSRVSTRVHVAETQLRNDEAIAFARDLNAGYVVVPTITHWEHRATEWSGRPSRMTIRITIIDAVTGNQITSTSIEGRSRIVSFTSTSPESLLRNPLAKYINDIY
jgi:hypothetical protein